MSFKARSMAALAATLLIVIVVGSVSVMWIGGWGPFSKPGIPGQTATATVTQSAQGQCPAGGCILDLPIKFTLTNKYTGAAIDTSGSSSMQILKLSGSNTIAAQSWEASETDSSGVWTTTKTYHSGDMYRLYIVTGNSKYQTDIAIPNAQQSQQASFPITVEMILVGTYTLAVLEPDGATTITASGNYNCTTKLNDNPTFTIIVSNSGADTGFTGTFSRADVIENGAPKVLTSGVSIKISETSATPNMFVSDWTRVAQSSDSFYYLKTIPDHAVDRDILPDSTVDPVLKGSYSLTFTVDATALGADDTEVVLVTYYLYLSTYYYGLNIGSANTEAYSADTHTFNILE